VRGANGQEELDAARRRVALLERAEQLASIGSWSWTPVTDEVLWSDNLTRLMGLDPTDGVVPSMPLLYERIHPDDRERVRREIEAARHSGEMPGIDMRIVRPDGEARCLRAIGGVEEVVDGGPRRLVGSVQDVTEQRRAEREIAAHVAVAEALSGWDTFAAGSERLLRELARALGFSVGTLWVPERDVLVPRVFWSEPSAAVAEFERRTMELRLPSGVGLPGRAWECRQPVERTSLHGPFVRGDAAERDGLRAGVAIPALAGEQVLAVVDLHSNEHADFGERLMRSLTGVGYELGAFLARRRGELQKSPLTDRELQVLQLAARGLSGPAIAERLMVSPTTVKTHFEHIYKKLRVSDRAGAVAHALREGLID
jgi:PAS domain S-box-containing protein